MIEIDGYRVFLGDLHTHWGWDRENYTLYLAGMSKLGLDFVLLCDGRARAKAADDLARAYGSSLRFFAGIEVQETAMHVACMLNDDEDGQNLLRPLPDSPPGQASVPEMLRRIKARCKLALLAHPGHTYAATWDGKSFQPVLDLYDEGLIDGFQPDTNQWYALEAIHAMGRREIPVAAGMDVHLCTALSTIPPYLYGQEPSVFSHIMPCFPGTTLVIADELSEDAIAAAVKAGRSCIFNIETQEITGPPKWVQRLQQAGFVQRYQEQVRREKSIRVQVPGGAVIGDPVRVEVQVPPSGEQVTLYHPAADGSLQDAVCTQGSVAQWPALPAMLKRAEFYFPLTVRWQGGDHSYAIHARQPVQAEWFERVEGPVGARNYFVDCELTNTTERPRQVKLWLDSGDLQVRQPAIEVSLEPRQRLTHAFELAKPARPGAEHRAMLRWASGSAGLEMPLQLSFAACRYLPAGEEPWRLIPEECLWIDSPAQMSGTWGGPKDLSLAVNLRWDEQRFYMYAQVTDDVFYQVKTGWETFWGDCIQTAFDAARTRRRGYNSTHEQVYAKTPHGDEAFVWYSAAMGDQQVKNYLKSGQLQIDRDEVAKETRYRLSMPWSSLAPFTPRTGNQFQYMLANNDNDGGTAAHVIGRWGGTISSKDMSQSHTVTLVGAE